MFGDLMINRIEIMVVLEIPLDINDRTTKRMLRINRMKCCEKDLSFLPPVSRRSQTLS